MGFHFTNLCKLLLPTDTLTSTYCKAARHISKFPDCFLSQFSVSVHLWYVAPLGDLEEWHVHQIVLLLPSSWHQSVTLSEHKLSYLGVNNTFLGVYQLSYLQLCPWLWAQVILLTIALLFFLMLSHAYYYFCYKCLHLPVGIRLACGWRFSKDTICQVFSLTKHGPMSNTNANTTPLWVAHWYFFSLSSILYSLRSCTFLIHVEGARPGGGWSLPRKENKN